MIFRQKPAGQPGSGTQNPYRYAHHDDSRLPPKPRQDGGGTISLHSHSVIPQVRLQLVEFGVKEEVVDRTLEKIGSDENLGKVALRNLHLIYHTLLDEDVGAYISSRPSAILMQTAMLARSLDVHPDGVRMDMPESGRILKRREVEPLPVVTEQESVRRRRCDELERGLCKNGVDAGTAYRFATELWEGEYDAEAAAKNIAVALQRMPREQVFALINGNRRMLCPLTELELHISIEGHVHGKLAKHLNLELGELAVGWSKLVTAAKICVNEEGVARLMRKIEALRKEAKSQKIDDERFCRFVNDNLVAIAYENDHRRLSGLLHHRMPALQNGAKKQWVLERLRHAKEHRVKGMDGKDLCRVLDGTGFRIVYTKGGGSHQRVEYEGEVVKKPDGRPLIMLVKTGDLSYGAVADVLDSLIEFMERKIQQNGNQGK